MLARGDTWGSCVQSWGSAARVPGCHDPTAAPWCGVWVAGRADSQLDPHASRRLDGCWQHVVLRNVVLRNVVLRNVVLQRVALCCVVLRCVTQVPSAVRMFETKWSWFNTWDITQCVTATTRHTPAVTDCRLLITARHRHHGG